LNLFKEILGFATKFGCTYPFEKLFKEDFSECLQFNEICRVLLTANLVTLQSVEALIGMLLDVSLL
jgi:hypothetical protein